MKKKILISLVACFIAAGSFVGYNLTENTSRLDVSLADISVMAQADGESGDITCTQHAGPGAQCWEYDEELSPPCSWTGYQYDFCIR